MVDIVVTYLNENDEQWQKDYNYWKDKEIKEGKAQANNRQAFGEERIRQWDAFKYWFRGVEKCCPWVNKVFVVVQNKNQIPEWLDTSNPKLRVVFHNEFIPNELLPTFNALTIVMYIANIKDLSENYIICDDDFYFLNPIEKDRFFKYGKPVHLNNPMPYKKYDGGYLTGTDNVFYRTLNNNLDFEYKVTAKKIKYGFYHLPEARKKSFEKWILDRYAKEINAMQGVSKFRNEQNLCPNIFCDLLKLCDKAWLGDPYTNCYYCNLDSTVNFDGYWDSNIVCFNDTERLDDYEKTKKLWLDFLQRKLPDKCSFEKGDVDNAV